MEYVIHTDGGSRGNPGPAAIGVVIEKDGVKVAEIGQVIGVQTNNVAEYSAILAALEYLEKMSPPLPSTVHFYLDSLLVVSQITGKFAVKHQEMKKLWASVQEKLRRLPCPVDFTHVPREENRDADALVNKALDESI